MSYATRLALLTSMVVASCFLPVQASDRSALPTIEQLIESTPVVNNEACRNIALKGVVTEKISGQKVKWDFEATFQTPDKFSMIIRDHFDGTPMMASSNGQMVIYDPEKNAIYYGSDSVVKCRLYTDEDSILYFLSTKSEKGGSSSIFLDPKSLLDKDLKRSTLSHDGSKAVRLKQTSSEGGSYSITYNNTDKGYKLNSFEIKLAGDVDPFLSFGSVVVDSESAIKDLNFPVRKLLGPSRFVDLPSSYGVGSPAKMCYMRSVARKVIPRESVDQTKFTNVSWDRIEIYDLELSSAMTEMFGTGK